MMVCQGGDFFCWWLLGYDPGGAPFSQLNKGVKDAMAISTKRCITSKTCTKNMQKGHKSSTNHQQDPLVQSVKEEGSGEIPTESTYARG